MKRGQQQTSVIWCIFPVTKLTYSRTELSRLCCVHF